MGKERLTTTRVALRAGVSVGTLYQYFPNKSALLQAALKQHMDQVWRGVESICEEQRGRPLEEMATALITSFLAAKMRDLPQSLALYSVSSDVDGARIVKEIGVRMNKAIVGMLKTSCEPLVDPELAASMLQGAMAGVSRRLLESAAPEKRFKPMLAELIFLATTYLKACSAQFPV